MQESCFIESDTGKENWETTVFKIGKDGWPSLECHDEKDVLGVGEERKVDTVEDGSGHS